MESHHPAVVATRALLALPAESGARFSEEWQAVERRVQIVHAVPVSHEIEPAGAPRLDAADE